jgi:hypothetical protein
MTKLLRAALRPRVVHPVLLAAAGTTLLCAAFVLGISRSRSEIVVTPPAVILPPLHVTVAPAPVVMPPTPVVVEAPAPPPPAPLPPVPPPHALVPMLDAACVIATDGWTNPTCAWDDGFPAISADGTLIATKYAPPMGPSNLYGLSIHFIDTKTSRVVRDSVILTPEELARILYPENAAPETTQPEDKQLEQRQRLLSTIYRRVAAVQRTLDAKRFRTLHELGSARATISDEEHPSQRGPDPVYAEIVGTTARIIDSAASQVLWRGEFWAAGPKRAEREASDCGGWAPWSIALWWDPETRHVLAAQTYRTGGCMCSDVPVETVQQMR